SFIPEDGYPEDVMKEVEIEVKYSPYIEKMLSEIEEFRNLEKIRIPENIDYNKIPGLSLEIREKLSYFKPLTLGQASRISGITPAAVSVLFVHLKKFS
ncbi:MAG: tRNA uridine-5-carboxymethylaminomethyl(34) synthesis enzyme MnmG, partial [Candidatus Omnitrophica bacterium]|nr:tRNA uridine-5-carboxymethylaminomethyl(34) synthesis enzyme MnmG [Candidatus Omnitrophota bacterium]